MERSNLYHYYLFDKDTNILEHGDVNRDCPIGIIIDLSDYPKDVMYLSIKIKTE